MDGPNGASGVSVITSAPLKAENSPEYAFTNLLLKSRKRNKFALIILNVSSALDSHCQIFDAFALLSDFLMIF